MADEAERLAKAARAKALLKKHQKKKIGVSSNAVAAMSSPLSGIISLSPPGSVFSPAASEVGDHPSEFGEISGAPHDKLSDRLIRRGSSATSPLLSNGSVGNAASLFSTPMAAEITAQLENQQKTITLLVAEKSTLSANLQQMEVDALEASKTHSTALSETHTEITRLVSRVSSLQDELNSSASARTKLISREQEQASKLTELSRELEQTKRSFSEVQSRTKNYEIRILELEEEAQANDRVEALEKSLKGTQDRAESLEFQLSKSKQAQAKLKADFDALQERHATLTIVESGWQGKHASLNEELSTVQQSMASLVGAQVLLQQQHDTLAASGEASKKALQDSERLLAGSQEELSMVKHLLEKGTLSAGAAIRRAEAAEAAQRKLQSENVELMASLNEMRPKVVELTQDKISLGDETDRLQRTIRALNGTVAHLEASLAESRAATEEALRAESGAEGHWRAEKEQLESNLKDLEHAHADIAEELMNSRSSIQELEAQRVAHRRAVSQYEENIEKLHNSTLSHEDELDGVQISLAESQRAEAELHSLLEQAQAELEGLHIESSSKDDELMRLRDQISIQATASTSLVSDKRKHGPSESLGDEMLNALQQQHALELSTARSQIRKLENAIYQEQNRSRTLQRQVTVMEDELRILRNSRPTAPPLARTLSVQSFASSAATGSGEKRTPVRGITALRGINPFDETALSADTRHKRKVSLSMLKARIESEREAIASVAVPPRLDTTVEESSPSRTPPLPTDSHGPYEPSRTYGDGGNHERHQYHNLELAAGLPEGSQFRDESHIFWCHACSGDLVVL